MNASTPDDQPGGAPTTEVLDPDLHLSASYALDQTMVRRLTGQLVATGEESLPAISPINGQPLGYIPQSTEADWRPWRPTPCTMKCAPGRAVLLIRCTPLFTSTPST